MKFESISPLISAAIGGGVVELFRYLRTRRKANAENVDAETTATENQSEAIMAMTVRVSKLAEQLSTLEIIRYKLLAENAKYKAQYGELGDTDIPT